MGLRKSLSSTHS